MATRYSAILLKRLILTKTNAFDSSAHYSLKQLYRSTHCYFPISLWFSSSSVMAEEGPVEAVIRTKLMDALKPVHLEVINESPMHNVPKGSESHFKVVIVAEVFDNVKRIKKHQLVHEALKEELENDIHALSIVAKSPKEWESSPTVPTSPPCRGGSGL